MEIGMEEEQGLPWWTTFRPNSVHFRINRWEIQFKRSGLFEAGDCLDDRRNVRDFFSDLKRGSG
jgi:hypothetical protein